MITLFIPTDKKEKSNIRGFWQSPDGKLYYDYLGTELLSTASSYKLESLRKVLNQEALFYVRNGIGYCFYSQDKTESLRHSKIFILLLLNKIPFTIYGRIRMA